MLQVLGVCWIAAPARAESAFVSPDPVKVLKDAGLERYIHSFKDGVLVLKYGYHGIVVYECEIDTRTGVMTETVPIDEAGLSQEERARLQGKENVRNRYWLGAYGCEARIQSDAQVSTDSMWHERISYSYRISIGSQNPPESVLLLSGLGTLVRMEFEEFVPMRRDGKDETVSVGRFRYEKADEDARTNTTLIRLQNGKGEKDSDLVWWFYRGEIDGRPGAGVIEAETRCQGRQPEIEAEVQRRISRRVREAFLRLSMKTWVVGPMVIQGDMDGRGPMERLQEEPAKLVQAGWLSRDGEMRLKNALAQIATAKDPRRARLLACELWKRLAEKKEKSCTQECRAILMTDLHLLTHQYKASEEQKKDCEAR